MVSRFKKLKTVPGLTEQQTAFFDWYWQGGARALMETQLAHFGQRRVTEKVRGEFSRKWTEEAFAKHLLETNPWSFENVSKAIAARQTESMQA
jgi:hypothetical protein